MDPRDAAAVLRWARDYHARGLLSAEALATVEAECAAARPGVHTASRRAMLSHALHAVGGAVLGLATLAILTLLLDETRLQDRDALGAWAAAAFAGVWLAVGVGTRGRLRNPDLSDAFLVAGAAALVGSAFFHEPSARFLAPAGVLLAASLALARRDAWVSALCVLAATVGAFHLTMDVLDAYWPTWVDRHEVGAAVLLALAWSNLTLLAFLRTRPSGAWTPASLVIATAAATLAAAIFGNLTLDLRGGWIEAFAAIPAAAMLAYALRVGEPTVVVAASALLGLLAVILAFDVGGALVGVPVVAGVAGGLLYLATWLRRRWLGAGAA